VEASAIRGSDARDPQEVRPGVPRGSGPDHRGNGEADRPSRRDLGVNEGTLGNWVAKAREAREGTEGLSRGDIEELKRLRAENADRRMERDVLKRSGVLRVKEATKWAGPASSPTRGPTTGCRLPEQRPTQRRPRPGSPHAVRR